MSIPYSRVTEITAVAGSRNCFSIPAPTRGILTRLIVTQVSGDLEGFEFDLFDRGESCREYVSMSESASEEGVHHPASHQLQNTQTVADGEEGSKQFQLVLPYINQDDRDPTNQRPKPYLYLSVTPLGSGEKKFEVAMTINQPIIV